MKSLSLSVRNIRKRISVPDTWLGSWVDTNGKQILLKNAGDNNYYVTVLDLDGKAFEIQLLDGKIISTIDLPAKFAKDTNENPILQIEAGSAGLGPTYDLYFLTVKGNGERRLASDNDRLTDVIIIPNIGMGLYDDWEDDLGVPWAFPLMDFKKQDQ
jgi:hypothetical protein